MSIRVINLDALSLLDAAGGKINESGLKHSLEVPQNHTCDLPHTGLRH